MIDPDMVCRRFTAMSSPLDERDRRLLVAMQASSAGYGGIAAVSRATGVAASTIGRGLQDLAGKTVSGVWRPLKFQLNGQTEGALAQHQGISC